MKSIKSKLFVSFVITIFVILLFLTGVTIYFFNLNQQTSMQKQINKTFLKIEKYILNNEDIGKIDKNIELQNQFLLIYQNDKLIFSNQSNHNTQKILYNIHEDRTNHARHHHNKSNFKPNEGLTSRGDYVLIFHDFSEHKKDIRLILGVDQKHANSTLSSVYLGTIILNIVVFIILSILGYFLIDKTIKPLKSILLELNDLQLKEVLSKRLKSVNTNDEFEDLVNSFNKMLNKIENSVEGIKQFSSDASHELRTPLTVIQGELDLIRDKDVSLHETKEILKSIDKEQMKLQDIIENFLLLSRLEKLNIQSKTISLDKVLFETIELNLEAIEEKSLELKLDIEEDLRVKFDEKYLRIVISNLMTNAIKYTHKGFIFLEAKSYKDKTILKVSDSGIGICEYDKTRIFERFFRADKSRSDMKEGLGLGLSIVKKICDKYNCNIKIKSEIDKGSSFILEFLK